MKKIIELQDATKVIQNGLEEERVILDQVSLSIYEGDFITVLGGNGAGKSTLFNVIAGTLPLTSGKILIHDTDVTNWSPAKRAQYISRVFQDPKMGTAPRMTLAENMLIAYYRGENRNLSPRKLKEKLNYFKELLKKIPNGLDQHLDTEVQSLSGGQRQALSLLMATLKKPDLLLLDEHTAALDPKTSKDLMKLTQQFVEEMHLTSLMITHSMEDAFHYGNRLLILENGCIIKDLNQEEKAQLSLQDYYQFFD
ncbi:MULTISPECIES: ATP-binding cassette domain-containing protein [unclassified Streptococcus]|uniref:ABC transporter ATP-binding protein n=1 Tax=unclassified Streptococcus TaxID=2608887 RepID=UPI0018CB44E3|nr:MULTISPECIES: ATP-binding cassette domain-containing protein [unclassified Streptococcus]MBG9366732.1 ATP-binding cassette domain-containing protein [Streptococcus sp. NLN64]MBJ6745516.1 ATP-binding cassette domain-containing protein [Streptococcus sp. 121]